MSLTEAKKPEEPPSSDGKAAQEPKKRRSPMVFIAPVVFIALAAYGIHMYIFSITHEVTDNALLDSDVVQIAPQVVGTVKSVLVSEADHVHAGQLIATLDDAKYRVAVGQANANLAGAIADAKQAGVDISLTETTGRAGETSAGGQVEQAAGGVGAAAAGIKQAQAHVENAKAAVAVAEAEASNSHLDIQTAQLNLTKSKNAVATSQAAVRTAQANVGVSQAAVDSAAAQEAWASKDLKRFQDLYASQAVSLSDLQKAETAHNAAKAALDSARKQLESSRATVEQRQADVDAAQTQVRVAENAIRQAEANAKADDQKITQADSGVLAARADLDTAQRGLAIAIGKRTQSLGEKRSAATTNDKVAMKQAERDQALARVDLAKAALANAQIDLEHTKIYAPVAGKVAKKVVQVGQLAQLGAPLLSIVSDEMPYVVANFKETQMHDMRVGEAVDIDVDAFPGKTFHGKVDSLSPATGSTFALLPPDNATGNFVKVVQRLPVKIVFDSGQSGLDRLRVGMSAVVTVGTR